MLVRIFQTVRRHSLDKINLEVAAIRASILTILLIASKVDICLNVPQQDFLVPSCRTVLNWREVGVCVVMGCYALYTSDPCPNIRKAEMNIQEILFFISRTLM